MNDEMEEVGRGQKTKSLKRCICQSKLSAVVNNHHKSVT